MNFEFSPRFKNFAKYLWSHDHFYVRKKEMVFETPFIPRGFAQCSVHRELTPTQSFEKASEFALPSELYLVVLEIFSV